MDLNKLTSARFIVTIMVTIIFCYLSARSKISAEAFMGVFGSIITYYFLRKRKEDNENNPVNPSP